MTYSEYLAQDYKNLVDAAKRITGNAPYAIELLHYSIVDFSYKPALQEVLDAGAARFYLVRVMMTQHRSVTGPFYRDFVKQNLPILGEVHDHSDDQDGSNYDIDYDKIAKLIENLPWYDRELFKLYAEGQHNYSTLSELTKIPRTSISVTIRRVREYIKSNL